MHGPISYRFRDKRRFQSRIANFYHPRVFNDPTGGVPLVIEYRRLGSKTRIIGSSVAKKSDDVFSRLDTIHECDSQRTDGHRPTASTAFTLSVAR